MLIPLANSLDLQAGGAIAAVAIAMIYLTYRAVSFFRKAASGRASACGGCVGGCSAEKTGPARQLVTLESLGSFPQTPK